MISIITPVYNGRLFMEACIETVINQACPYVEHIIVDGASTDGTHEIIKKYADRYPHIRWISEPDSGQSDAMNKGLIMAKGAIIGFLNVDDFYEPNVLGRVLAIFETLPVPSLLVGNCNVWDNEGSLYYVNKPAKLKFTDLLKGYNVNPHPVNPSAYFYHASLHSQIGPYDNREHYALDLDFLLRAVQAANVHYVDETWGNWRQLEGTKTVMDARSGRSTLRAKGIIRKYRSKMPLFQRWYHAVLYGYYHTINEIRHCTLKYGHLMMKPREPPITFLERRLKQGRFFTRGTKED
jgi:glycosyltransferase involved in cell wall biosynthesis